MHAIYFFANKRHSCKHLASPCFDLCLANQHAVTDVLSEVESSLSPLRPLRGTLVTAG